MKLTEMQRILVNAERFTSMSGDTDELNINKEDITNELLALANGFKACGGDVYILQTLGLRSIIFDLSERRTDLDFMSWAMNKMER